jgi:uroporphyrinogen decarboxylase
MSVFIRACKGEATEHTPIWLMRQAGRYQPDYRALREKVSFLELCKTPELAAQVTLKAVQDLGVDAAIIFADILLPLEPLGVGFSFEKGMGPKIHEPIRTSKQVDAVAEEIDPNESLGYVMESIRQARSGLDVPLIGFAGAPFTLASYVIEGKGTRTYYETKKMMFGDTGAWHTLMSKLSRTILDYLNAQIQAGAQAVQLFDSWIGCLGPRDYKEFVQPHVKMIFDGLDKSVPSIHFGTGNPRLYPLMKEAGGDVIGVDWRVSIGETWDSLGRDEVAIMGNLDPGLILAPHDVMFAGADRILQEVGTSPGHIFNLGHGIMPQASVAQARALVDHVHAASARMRG